MVKMLLQLAAERKYRPVAWMIVELVLDYARSHGFAIPDLDHLSRLDPTMAI